MRASNLTISSIVNDDDTKGSKSLRIGVGHGKNLFPNPRNSLSFVTLQKKKIDIFYTVRIN